MEHAISTDPPANIKVVLDLAPKCQLSDELLQHISIITPNKTEAEMITGVMIIDDAPLEKAAHALHDKGIETRIITLGSKGAVILHNNICTRVEAPKVNALNTTAAGYVFNGALVVSLSAGNDVKTATELARRSAAVFVTRMGAQTSAPSS